jgi:hypothetical protein
MPFFHNTVLDQYFPPSTHRGGVVIGNEGDLPSPRSADDTSTLRDAICGKLSKHGILEVIVTAAGDQEYG